MATLFSPAERFVSIECLKRCKHTLHSCRHRASSLLSAPLRLQRGIALRCAKTAQWPIINCGRRGCSLAFTVSPTACGGTPSANKTAWRVRSYCNRASAADNRILVSVAFFPSVTMCSSCIGLDVFPPSCGSHAKASARPARIFSRSNVLF